MIYEERRGLASRIWRASDTARESGALVPLATEICRVAEGPGAFEVRILSAASLEARESYRRDPGVDPFLPYDERLFVAKLSETHVCLLNKFPVIPGHALVVTREFEPQTRALTSGDFEALVNCLMAFDGLAFYNAGNEAGASEPHKHLQIVPLPLVSDALDAPITAWFDHGVLPFRHRLVALSPEIWRSEASAVTSISDHVSEMLAAFDLLAPGGDTRPYNLLVTRRWIMLVPRRVERFGGFSINGLGFAGALLVHDSEQLALLRAQGPMAALEHVVG